jgi:hypothetical protein
MNKIALGIVVVLSVIGTMPGTAQVRPRSVQGGAAVGVSIDRFSVGSDDHYPTATLHVSSLHPNKFTPEFSWSVFAESLGEESLISNLDVGGAVNIPMPGGMLLLRGGATGLFVLGRDKGALPGAHYGVSFLLKAVGNTALRIDVLRRVYLIPFELGQPTLSIGIGLSSFPRI